VARREPLTAEDIHAEALRVLDTEGLAGLNARNLTSRLACSTKTVYQLAGNRDAMVRAVVARAFAEMDLHFRPGPDLPSTLLGWARTLHHEMLARPWLGTLMTPADREATVAYVVRLVDALVAHGLRRRTAVAVAGNVGHWTVATTLLDIRAPGEWDHPQRFEETLDWLVRGIVEVHAPAHPPQVVRP
jgi:AcrR family transcriptional regulator